jgi:hypothetical protein
MFDMIQPYDLKQDSIAFMGFLKGKSHVYIFRVAFHQTSAG